MQTIKLMRKVISIPESQILAEYKGDGDFARDWRICSGDWQAKDGWMVGYNPINGPGVMLSRQAFPGNIMLDFEAETIPPSDHDIDWMWNAHWDEAANARGNAYVGGFQGWWEGKAGIERSPDYKLVATVPAPGFIAGKCYHIQSGSIDGHCFIVVDGRLLLEMIDPDPEKLASGGHIGFEAYASHFRVRNVMVRQISWTPVDSSYPELAK